ncbi:hypothetical protein [Flavobacterium sp. 1355]|uniref:hypothetical protein n=1 Tax=Flavobacterium sp. 1355 TaxID=2806571 RepID=UPI001AEA4F82|nr:hypothetical protein [Flavobacterium sp. 1355]MBP1222670.1 hypothetical protein [Flavobacterium sp. 1355]
MKTALYALVIMVLSFASIKAIIPKEYPPKKVKEERVSIRLKEQKLNNLIDKLEYDLKVDSMKLETIKNQNL